MGVYCLIFFCGVLMWLWFFGFEIIFLAVDYVKGCWGVRCFSGFFYVGLCEEIVKLFLVKIGLIGWWGY